MTLKIKGILPAKLGLFRDSRELQLAVYGLWQNHRQTWRVKRRSVLLERKAEEFKRAVINKEAIGGNWEFGA